MRWVAIIFYLLFCMAGFGAIQELRLPGGSLTTVLVISILSFVAVLAHEAGHALAAVQIGGRVVVLVALPFELRFRPMRVSLAPRRKHRDIGGYVHYVPPGGQTTRQSTFVSAAGPLANFALVPVVLLLGVLAAAWFGSPELPALLGSPEPAGPNSGLLPSDEEVRASLHLASGLRSAEASRLIADALALVSAGMGVANLIPFAGSDGAAILHEWRSRLLD